MKCKSQIKVLTTAFEIIQNVLKDQQDLLDLKIFSNHFWLQYFPDISIKITSNFRKAHSDKQATLQSHKTSN